MLAIMNVELIQFQEARFMSETNHRYLEKGKKIKKLLSLSEDEQDTLNALEGKELISKSLVLYQKLLIKKALYEGVNNGKFLYEINFGVPLEEEVKQWSRSFGYALSAKPNTIWVTGRDGWQYESIDSPPPSKTEFTLLW